MSTPPPAPPGKGPAGFAAKAGGKRNLLIAAAVGTAAVAYVMSRSGGAAAAGGGSADQIMTGYDSTPYDQYNSLQNQLEDMQNQIDAGRVVPGTPATPTPTPPSPKPPLYPGSAKPVPRPVPKPVPTKTAKKVVIKRGDTLSAIAKRSGISMATLKKLNPVFWTNKKYRNGNTIWAGGSVRVS